MQCSIHLKKFRKKLRFEETLGKVPKKQIQQHRKTTKRLYKHKTKYQNRFHINSIFKNLLNTSKYYYILTFTCLMQVFREQFGQSGKKQSLRPHERVDFY